MTAPTAISGPRLPVELPGYRLTQLLGQGGMGAVHEAEQLSLKRLVAVKLLHRELASNAEFVARFDKEAAALAALRHPNIVSIVDRGTVGDTYYLVMELVDGPSLRERMRDPKFDQRKALQVLLQVARAVDYAHHRGIVHRDLKPENILFDEQAGDVPKVTDFGLAALDPKLGDVGKNLTQTHVSMGTASYMAPEQRIDAKTAGPPADVYALGTMLYELVVGELPLGAFEPPSVRKPGVDKRLDAIVARCLKPEAKDRYATAGELLVDLEPVAAPTQPPTAVPLTRAQRLLAGARRGVVLAGRALGGAVVLAALAVLALAAVRDRRPLDTRTLGQRLTTDDGARVPLSTTGRLDRDARTLTLGEGPDSIAIIGVGRAPTLQPGAIVFEAGDDTAVGRATVDVEQPGDGLLVATKVDTEAGPPPALAGLRRAVLGPAPSPKSALMLLGADGRYVALVVGAQGEPPVLDWALGAGRQGTQTAPLVTTGAGQSLGLRVDPETGELAAVVGEGRDSRVLGEALKLGNDWLDAFGRQPVAAVGCLDGRCAFRDVRVQGLVRPSWTQPPLPQPLPLPDAALAPPSKAAPTPVRTAKATPKPPAAAPKPPPAKKPTPAPAPKPAKRLK